MANGSFIGKAKSKIIKEFIKDKDILTAIDSDIDINESEKYVNTHIFNYHQNPHTLNTVITFITVQVHIPQVNWHDFNPVYVRPTVEIWIISHERHMYVDNVPKVTQNRNDYISELIDIKLNGRSDFGIGNLELTTNVEGSFQYEYLYRRMIFTGRDLNNSLCEDV